MLSEEIEGLRHVYQEVAVANGSGGQKLIRVNEVTLPKGCSPATTSVLLVPQPGQPKPQIYVKPGIQLSNGREPRSVSLVQVEGESWLQFSYSFPWDENSHTLVQFIEAALRRFAKLE